MTSVWTIVLITVDRYTALCMPLSKARQFIANHAKKFMFAVPIISIIYNVPRFLSVLWAKNIMYVLVHIN